MNAFSFDLPRVMINSEEMTRSGNRCFRYVEVFIESRKKTKGTQNQHRIILNGLMKALI